MEVNELASRFLRRYWLILLTALVLPAVAIGAYVAAQPRTYTAHARIVAAVDPPKSQAEAAAVVSQVQAIATSRDVVAKALSTSGLSLDPDRVARSLVLTGLGTSAVVDLAYSDSSASMAVRVTNILATAVATTLDQVRIGGLPQVLQDIDNQLSTLADKRAPIAAAAQASPNNLTAQARLTSIDSFIAALTGNRDRLAEDAATSGHTTVIQNALTPTADGTGLTAKAGVGALLGLVLGLLLVGMRETLYPAVSGPGRVARLLEVPWLGSVSADPPVLTDIGRRLRLAGRRAGVSTVVLMRADHEPVPPELVDRIQAATLRPDPVTARTSIPVPGTELPIVGTGVSSSDGGSPALGSVAVLTVNDNGTRTARIRRVCAIDELDPSAEADRIGLVVVADGYTRLTAVDAVRDVTAAAGWPVLGVLGAAGPAPEQVRWHLVPGGLSRAISRWRTR